MAQVVGQLRREATPGEILVLDLLKTNLPKDVTVYVETPIYLPRKASHPDFIVLTNYGFVILEVKDWANFTADKHFAKIKTRGGEVKHSNPVEQARDYALDLISATKRLSDKKHTSYEAIPYGYAVVFPFFPSYEKEMIQDVWGESFVLFQEDLNNYMIKQSIRNTIRLDKISPIKKETMDLVRGAINPEITSGDGVILDEDQSKLVFEPITEEVVKPVTQQKSKEHKPITQALFADDVKDTPENELPLENEQIISGNSIRLVRGVMGSGKTLVLLAKAKRWAKMYPDWNILVLSYNKELAQSLRKELRGHQNIRTNHLDQLLREIITAENAYLWTYPIATDGWVENHKNQFEIIQKLGSDFVSKELSWIQEVMIDSREEYLDVKRVGRGNQVQINKSQRNEIYNLLLEQNRNMENNRQVSWELLYLNFLKWVDTGLIKTPQFDAILIDEAQDFAPSWIAVVNKLLKPNGNLFMVDDPTQSIFRYFSWRQRGVDVLGRTRYLKLPYRNTREIYTAAQSMVKEDGELVGQLKSEGEEFLSQDDLSSMRSGDRPLLITLSQPDKDVTFVESQIQVLKRKAGVEYENMCVILPNGREAARFGKSLSKYKVKVITPNRVKGLTYEVVFLCGLEHFFRKDSVDDLSYVSHQRRVIYSCMGRARRSLYLLHHNKISDKFEPLKEYVDFFKF